MAEAPRPERHVEEKLTPDKPTPAQYVVCAAMILVGLLLAAAGILVQMRMVLRVILVAGGVVAVLAGFLRAAGALHLGVSTSEEGVHVGAHFPRGYTRTLDVSTGLIEGSPPPKTGELPSKEGAMPPKEGEVPGSPVRRPTNGTS